MGWRAIEIQNKMAELEAQKQQSQPEPAPVVSVEVSPSFDGVETEPSVGNRTDVEIVSGPGGWYFGVPKTGTEEVSNTNEVVVEENAPVMEPVVADSESTPATPKKPKKTKKVPEPTL